MTEEGEAGFHVDEHTWQSGDKRLKGSRIHESSPPAQPPICSECSSKRIWKDGIRYNVEREIQRYLCRDCGFRFSEPKIKVDIALKLGEASNPRPELLDAGVIAQDVALQKADDDSSFPFREDVASHELTTVGKALNSFPSYNSKRRVCVSEVGAKNLAEVESRIEKWAAGATTPDEATARGKIVEFAWWLEKEGYKLSTIKHKVRSLKWLTDLGANILDSETVKEAVAKKQSWDESTKAIVCDDYGTFLEMQGLTWRKPSYKHSERMPFIPLESELDALINAAGKTVGAFLQGLKDTGADPSELANTKWTDINPQNKTVTINYPVKGYNPRILPISDEFLRRLSTIPKKYERLFNINNISTGFYQQRKSIARKLNNPRIKEISLTTFRHWKGTIEYHKTKDPYHVKKILGHKKLTSTEVYINLDQAIFEESDDFIVKIANTTQEACKLIETGFEYVTGEYHDGGKIFKKRK